MRTKDRLDRGAARPNDGVVDWLLACPEKGFFVPVVTRREEIDQITAGWGRRQTPRPTVAEVDPRIRVGRQ